MLFFSQRESNARLVRFSDGSRFLYLGSEVFSVNLDTHRASNRNLCFQSLNGVDGVKKAVGQFGGTMGFRVLNIHSKTHQKLKEAIQLTHVTKPKIQIRYDMSAASDVARTSQHVAQLEKDDEARRRKRERLTERERYKRGDTERARQREKRDRVMMADFLEDDDDDEEAEETFTRSSSSHSKRRRVDDSDEDEEEASSRLVKAKNASYDDEDEEEDRKKSKDEPDDDVVIRKGKSKRRKLDDDDEEGEDEE